MEKSNQNIGKTHNYPRVPKSYLTSQTGIGGCKKKEVISNSKTTTLTYFDKLKRRNNVKVVNIFTFHSYVNSDRMIILLVYSLFHHLQLLTSSQKYFSTTHSV